MADPRALYGDAILEHNRRPRNCRAMEEADRTAEGHNPLCGDQITLYLRVAGDVIREICFQGTGCAISQASASMLTVHLEGKSIAEAERLSSEFRRMVAGVIGEANDPMPGELGAFAGVRDFPGRVNCASLAWETFSVAVRGIKGE